MRNFFKSNLVREVTIYIIIAVIAFGAAHFARSEKDTNQTQETNRVAGVSVLVAEPRVSVEIPYTASGQVRAEQSTDIQSVVSGTMLSFVSVGSEVSIGTPLFKVSNPGIEQGYFAALAALANAENSSAQSGFVTESQLEEARIRVSSAELALQQVKRQMVDAETATALAEKQSEDTTSIAYDTAYRSLESAVRDLGGPNLDGFVYDDVTSNYVGGIGELKNHFDAAIISFKQTPKEPGSNLLSSVQILEQAVAAAKNLSQSTWTYLRLAVPNPYYTNNQIDSAVANVGSVIGSLNAADAQIKNARNSLQSTREQGSATLAGLRTQIQITENALDSARQSLATQLGHSRVAGLGSQNQINAARSQLASIQYQYQNLSLASPFSGTVISHGVTLGAQVSPGQRILTLGNLNIVEIRIEVAPDVAAAVRLGQEVVIEGGESGRVSEIEAAGSLSTGNIGITIESDNSNKQFVPGTTAEVTLVLTQDIPGTYVMPLSALVVTQTESFVFIAESEKVAKRIVTAGKVFGEFIEITAGLSPGDQVITTRPGLLEEGEEVEIQN